nr:unnamed protein product [Digitaria exilis]
MATSIPTLAPSGRHDATRPRPRVTYRVAQSPLVQREAPRGSRLTLPLRPAASRHPSPLCPVAALRKSHRKSPHLLTDDTVVNSVRCRNRGGAPYWSGWAGQQMRGA